ncbi:RsiV family protein [Halobacillus yeomjeoni]|uniref:DUF3298 domain-containing protein n=1 Tax=Halobacillus yeomjeoni TaxID=311194 RepID=A0A931HWU2_9BACI|nr:RsiV family protein [Halobacillus yeomjeoni]MBH0231125.1 DUF3298 domain-containing protein [Halobacillus yeomjeoni]
MKHLCSIILSLLIIGNTISVEAESLYKIRHKDKITQDWEIHVDYPLFEHLKNKTLQEEVNREIVQKLEHTFRNIRREASEFVGFPVLYYEESTVYKQDDYYSVVMNTSITRGEQYHSTVSSVNFIDSADGKITSLKDLVHMDILNGEVRKVMAQDRDTFLYHKFNGVRENTAFYITEGQLVLVFNKYEVAAGVHGNPEIRIELKRVLKKEDAGETYAPFPIIT